MAMTDWFEPTTRTVDVANGRLTDPTGSYEKRLADLDGLYADAEAFARAVEAEGERVVYSVTEFRPSENAGDMIFGVTRMEPGRIGNEFYVTRGHLHARADRPEIYFGQGGAGLMLLEAPDGTVRIETVAPGRIVYVPPYWIHRSVNTGADVLVMMFVYPADAGQDYDIIARAGGMASRIVQDGASGWRERPNLAYRPRGPEEVARLLGSAS